MKPALLTPLLATFIACAPPALVEQDVSFLAPLSQARSFLPAAGPGSDGAPLISKALFDALHPLTVVDEPEALYAALATIGVRLDACFTEGRDKAACRPQLRLVLQPVFDSADGVTTRDAAVHLFYSTDEAEVLKAAREFSLLRTRLGVQVGDGLSASHPGFATAAWVDGVKKVLLPLVRSDRLVRVTTMSVHASNQAWIFGGFELDADKRTAIVIPTLSPALEHHVSSTGGPGELAITLDPLPAAEPTLVTALHTTLRLQASATAVDDAARAVERLEDPAAHNPGTTDCASCHVAAATKWYLTHEAPAVAVDQRAPASDAFSNVRNLRAFGYFFQTPSFSPRLLRETTAVRADLSSRLDP